jgi:hypothetical protein
MNQHAIIVIKRNSYRALFVVNTFVKFRRRYITLEKRETEQWKEEKFTAPTASKKARMKRKEEDKRHLAKQTKTERGTTVRKKVKIKRKKKQISISTLIDGSNF